MAEASRRIIIPQVEEDRLWKDNIRRNMVNQFFVWPSKWSFLVDEYNKLDEALAGKRPLSPYDRTREFVKPLKGRKMEPAKLYLPPIKKHYAKHNVPRTTNGWYGHLHKEDGHNIVWDRQQWTKGTPQHDLIKLLGWPMDYYD